MELHRLSPRRRPDATRRPSVGIRRSTSTMNLALPGLGDTLTRSTSNVRDSEPPSRRRSFSDPVRADALGIPDLVLQRPASRATYMATVAEEPGSRTNVPQTQQNSMTPELQYVGPVELDAVATQIDERPTQRPGMIHRASGAARSMLGLAPREAGKSRANSTVSNDEYDANIVDFLDVVDPEVSTLSTLTNVQNSLFIPDLGPLLNRRATYTLTPRPQDAPLFRTTTLNKTADQGMLEERDGVPMVARRGSFDTINSELSESRYAVLPHGISLQGWSEAEKEELDDHVRHLLHSKRAAFTRGMKGFRQYVKKPLGLFVTVYATLVTLFGLAWVLFLIGWINVGGKQLYIINVIDNVLVGLFALMGDGLAPFRAVDTYHMIFIAHYHYKSWKLRDQRNLPKLEDKNDLPSTPIAGADDDLEAGDRLSSEQQEKGNFSVLSPKQQRRFKHHQDKFSKSHTFYKPHETNTHFAFPIQLLITIVVLLDFHSIFQIALGTCTWSINYHVRPFALTTVILCCSLTCNITGGILISVGDKKTRKKEVFKRMFRQQLTETAIAKIEKRRQKEELRNQELDQVIRPDAAGASPELGSKASPALG